MRSPHVEAQYHLPLLPGTNVAVLSAMAHIIVTEGLVNEDFVRERCEWDAFQELGALRRAASATRPEATEGNTGVPAADLRAAARLFATGGNAGIYYGLGVTEHSQGSTTVMAIANLVDVRPATSGKLGAGVNPLRGQNNVQGACDMGSFPHEFTGYRHVSNDDAAPRFRAALGCDARPPSRGCASPTCWTRRSRAPSRRCISRARTSPSPTPTPSTSPAGLRAMECVVVQDLFLNETAKYAHVFLPGSSFLEKDGTFTNAERRINRVRRVMSPMGGLADWEATVKLSNALGFPMSYTHPSQIMDEIAALTPSFAGVSYAKLDEKGSIQWPCNDAAPYGTPMMHVDRFVRGMGRFMLTEYVATEERTGARFPLILTTGRILSQYNVGAQTRRTENSRWHEEDLLEIHPFDAESRGLVDGDLVALASRSGDIALRAKISERMQPGVVYTTFHHAKTGANVITTDFSDWATNCPEYKVTAVQVRKTNRPSDWQAKFYEEDESLTRIASPLADAAD